jgi:ArsR family transcriptional regulator
MQVRICKAFANAARLKMLDLLSSGERPVSELQARLNVSAANTSQHLAILKSAGIVSTRREGKQIYCALAIPEVKTACVLIRDVLRARMRHERAVVS